MTSWLNSRDGKKISFKLVLLKKMIVFLFYFNNNLICMKFLEFLLYIINLFKKQRFNAIHFKFMIPLSSKKISKIHN